MSEVSELLESLEPAEREMLDEARERLRQGDVAETRYGLRVALRPDLGDNRRCSGAGAYWPENDRGCRCHAKRTRGTCSHEIAARILRAMECDEEAGADMVNVALFGNEEPSR